MLKNFLNIFTRPGEVFERLKDNPTWLIPLLVILIISALSYIPVHKIIIEYKLAEIENRVDDETQIEEIKSFLKSPLNMIISIIGVIVTIAVSIFLSSLVYYGVALLFGGQINYLLSLSVVTFANLITIPGSIITSLLIFFKKSIYAGFNLSLILPDGYMNGFTFTFLSQIDLFTVWSVYLCGLGISIVGNLKKKVIIPVFFFLWIIWLIVTSLIGTIFK